MMLTAQLVRRARREFGLYSATDWQRFLLDNGMTWREIDAPMPVPAFRHGSSLFLARDLSIEEKAIWAWHEIAHTVLHAGITRWWESETPRRDYGK